MPHPRGAILLSALSDAALDDLERDRERCGPLLVPKDLRASAWAGLVTSPSTAIPLSIGEPTSTGPEWLRPADHSMMRRLGLAAVFSPQHEALTEAGISAPRSAAVATLTLLTAQDGDVIERAHIEAEWHHSALGVLSGLERLDAMALTPGVSSQTGRPVTLLIHPDISTILGVTDREWLAAVARLLECDLQIVDRLTLDSRSVARRVADSPRLLLAVGPLDRSATELISRHEAAGHDRVAQAVHPSGTRALTDEIAEALLGLAGVGAALMPVLPPTRAVSGKTREARPEMPFDEASQCRHLPPSRVYVQDAATELWWTRDDDRHADSIFKTYKQVGEKLFHQADRHALGEIVENKHKGPSGEVINLADCHKCNKPNKHRK
jgi:hypothetical protein